MFAKVARPDVSSALQPEVAQGLERHHKVHGKSTVLRQRTVGEEGCSGYKNSILGVSHAGAKCTVQKSCLSIKKANHNNTTNNNS